jgi:hypothetical protein
MRAGPLAIKLAIYYLVVIGGTYLVLKAFPDMRHYLPVGGAQELIGADQGKSALVAIVGALMSALPVSWMYMATRTDEEYDQSLISSILILPVVVTSIVVVVQNSLALAFALGGIAGAVRFKNSLKSSGDALYILLSVGMGLAAGIGAVELAFVMALAFNVIFLILWVSEYGERAGMKRFMTDFNPDTNPSPVASTPVPATEPIPPSPAPPKA